MKRRCCFAGHSKLYNTEEIYAELIKNIERLIVEESVSEFMVGNYGSFDSLSAKAVRSLKPKYSEISLVLVIPYLTKTINEYKEMYYENYDTILMADIPENTPQKLRILKCNEYMVNNSAFILCYVEHSSGGAARTLEFAENKADIEIINIAKVI